MLDFGLAKALAGDAQGPDLSQSPTMTASMGGTREGVILGTAAYMSPEQARGQTLDKRTDIWSFGCVLYEILAGRRVFGQGTVVDTISSVLGQTPDWNLLPEVTPTSVRLLLRRCLEKDRRRRLHDVADARIELEELKRDGPETEASVPNKRLAVGHWAWLPWGLVAALSLFSTTLWVRGRGDSAQLSQPMHLSIWLPNGHSLAGSGYSYPMALSRDGRRFAYVATEGDTRRPRLFLRQLDDPTVREVPDSEGARYPFFSPDGESVGFWAQGWLQRVPFSGGQPLRMTAIPDLDRGAAWGPDDTLVVASTTDGLQRVSVAGGTPEPVLDDGRWPWFLDDGRLLFTTSQEIQVLDLDDPEPRVLYVSPEPVLQARFLPSGHLLFGSAGRVIALPMDVASFEVDGAPTVVLEDVFEGVNGGAAFFDVSNTGTVAFVPGSTRHSLMLVDRSGVGTLLSDRRDAYRHPSLSPDGNRLAVTIDADPDPSNTWILDIERGNWRRLTLSGHNLDPHWTPDGAGISFCANQGRGREPLLQALDGSDAIPLLPDEVVNRLNQCLQSWSPDASSFLFHEIHPERGMDLWLFDGSGPEPSVEEWLATPFGESQARISPNGRWVVYTSGETGQAEVYVRPLMGTGETVLVSSGGGAEGQWRADGRELFYRAGGQIMAVDVLDRPDFAIAEPRRLFADVYDNSDQFNYAAFPDGNHFLMIERDPRGDGRQVELILNWTDELERLVPTN